MSWRVASAAGWTVGFVVVHLAACTSFGAARDVADASTTEASTGRVDSDTGTVSVSTYASEVLSDEPLAYWRMDDAPEANELAPHLYDEVSMKTLGTREGTVSARAPGALGDAGATAFRFDGGYLKIAVDDDAFSFRDKATFTLELWVLRLRQDIKFAHLVTKQYRPPAAKYGYAIYLYNDSINFERVVNGIDAKVSASFPVAPTFRHVAAVFDGSSLRLYIDGEDVGFTNVDGGLTTTVAPFLLGTEQVGSEDVFHGSLDEVAIYKHALAPKRIRAHYDAAKR